MNDIQHVIDRQIGINCRFNYDNILKRLVVLREESYYGLMVQQAPNWLRNRMVEVDPPIFACRFAETRGYEHILALANEDGKVAIQNTSKVGHASLLQKFDCHNNAVFDLAWMPGQMKFITVSGDHTACLWDIAEGTPVKESMFLGHTKSVKTTAFQPTHPSLFATGARDGHILIWDIRAAKHVAILLKPDNSLINCHSRFTPKTPGSNSKRPRFDNQRAISITGLVYQDDQTLLSCGECDGNIKVWDLRKNYNIYTREPLPKHSIPYCGSSTRKGYTNLVLDESRIKLYASCMDNVIYCFNVSTYNSLPEQRYMGHQNGTFYIKTSLSADGMYLVSGSSDKFAYLWNVRYCRPLLKLASHNAEVTCTTWCKVGVPSLVTCSDDAKHNIWRLGPEEEDIDVWLEGMAQELLPSDKCYGLDNTPISLKQLPPTPTSSSAKPLRSEAIAKKTKRCLTELMDAAREGASKTLKPDAGSSEGPQLIPTGSKRTRSDCDVVSPKKSCESSFIDWSYPCLQPGTSFLTPTKNFERKTCKVLSPKSTIPLGRNTSPAKPRAKRVISFTADLPNFVIDGEAPHLKLMSPAKKKLGTTDWLTLMVREKKGKIMEVDKSLAVAPLSPKQAQPANRSSVLEKTPKSNKTTGTLYKYFTRSAAKNK